MVLNTDIACGTSLLLQSDFVVYNMISIGNRFNK